MPGERDSAALIDAQWQACAAAVYAGGSGGWRTAAILAHAPAEPDAWELKLIHLLAEILPPFTQIVLVLLYYGIVIAGLVQVVRNYRGAERVFGALFLCDAFLGPLRMALPAAAATWILYVQTAANAVMFAAAIRVWIGLWETTHRRERAS